MYLVSIYLYIIFCVNLTSEFEAYNTGAKVEVYLIWTSFYLGRIFPEYQALVVQQLGDIT